MKPDMDDVLTAIREKCMDCSGHSRRIVEHCVIKDCPLYPYRSVKSIGNGQEKETEIKGQIDLFEALRMEV